MLADLSYNILTADQAYISKDLEANLAKSAVDPVPPEKAISFHHPTEKGCFTEVIVESSFSSFDRLGLSERPRRANPGLVHVYTAILAYQLLRTYAFRFWIALSRIGVSAA